MNSVDLGTNRNYPIRIIPKKGTKKIQGRIASKESNSTSASAMSKEPFFENSKELMFEKMDQKVFCRATLCWHCLKNYQEINTFTDAQGRIASKESMSTSASARVQFSSSKLLCTAQCQHLF